jgi:signal transduction histidine kinase/ActR/RegA family two-component response regulator
MERIASETIPAADTIGARTALLFEEQRQSIITHTDRLFAWLMVLQWIAGVAAAQWIAPITWTGVNSEVNPHLLAAVFLGGIITALPVFLALTQPGRTLTRHTIAVGQMMMSALLIHLTTGRIETHFHVFGSLAILAFYRDWRVLISASAVVYFDHLLRGIFWPQSVYGVTTATIWRSLEHAGWVIFEVTFLIVSIRKSLSEMQSVAERQAKLEAVNVYVERQVAQRTAELTRENAERRQAEKNFRQSEEQLRQAQKMEAVGRLAGGVAHDFNNLLTVITGFCGLTLQHMEKGHPLRKNAVEIQGAAERAASLTGQLLAFSRKQVLQPRVLQLDEVVAGMEKMLHRVIGEDIELSTISEPGLGRVKADPGQIEQVIVNLAVNARDAMPRGGKLTIRTSNVYLDQSSSSRNRQLEVGNYVLLAISDTGIGMTDEVKEHLFEPFFTTKGVGRGTGLGLATSYGIITQSDGDIRVYSELDRGTTFKIYLPRVDSPMEVAASGQQASDAWPTGTESVLVVEDDGTVRNLTVTILRECGYRVHEAHDGIEALKMIEQQPALDLVITDVIMPKMSGKELHNRMKICAPRVKVLFMSGYTDDALVLHDVLDPELFFLEKPFSPARLSRKVREVLDNTKSQRLSR